MSTHCTFALPTFGHYKRTEIHVFDLGMHVTLRAGIAGLALLGMTNPRLNQEDFVYRVNDKDATWDSPLPIGTRVEVDEKY